MTIREIQNSPRNEYNQLSVDTKKALKSVYPDIEIETSEPGCFGHRGTITLRDNTLSLPDGQYDSAKHFHTAGNGVCDVENARGKLNARPLFLLMGYGYNGDYRSLTKTYYLFGANEDSSFFLHRIRPRVGELCNIPVARIWLWSLKEGEKIRARQGDLAFILIKRPSGKIEKISKHISGSHEIQATEIRETVHKTYALNPIVTHAEHGEVTLLGWHEIRIAKVWAGGNGD